MNQLLKVRVFENKNDTAAVDISLGLSKGEKENLEFLINKLKENKSSQIEKNKKDIEKHEQILKEYSEAIKGFNSKIKTLTESIADEQTIRREINSLHDYQRSIEKGIKKYNDDITYYEKTDKCDTCKQEISVEYRDKMIGEFHGKMHELSSGLIQLGYKISKKEERTNEIQAVTDDINEQESESVKLRNSVEACQEYIKKVTAQNVEISKLEDDTEQTKKHLEEAKEDIEIYTIEKEKLSNEKYLYEIAGNLLKDGGIKAKIVKQYLPIINKYISSHLSKMDFYVSFELDEGFNETIKSRYRDEFTYDSFSEGEKMRIDLALLFTWRAVAKLKNSVNTNLLILDEVFDSSLDAAGTDEFLKILYDLAGNVNVFVISHKGEILYDKFDTTIKFEKYKNFSRIV